MVFKASEFMNSPDVDEFDNLKKDDLVLLAKHLNVEFKVSMRKQTIKNLLIDKLIELDIFGEDALQLKVESANMLDLKRMEMEHEFKMKEMEMRIHREIELEKIKHGIEHKQSNTKSESESERFDAAKNIRLVPKFSEKAVDKYFPQFEKIAENLKWPKPIWSTMLQSVLSGKAAEVYSALSTEQSSDYDIVKREILKAYELVPEAYRQKFRSYKKYENQTYVEFAREKEDLFDRWLTSKKIDKNFDKLRQLLLLEEFKQCVHYDLKTHLDDKNIDTLQNAAIASDNYSLTHKKSFKGPNMAHFQGRDCGTKNQSTVGTERQNNTKAYTDPALYNPTKDSFQKKSITCGYCKKSGHVISECFKLQRRRERDSKPQPSGCTAPVDTVDLETPAVSQVSMSSACDYMEDYKPFLSQGFISLDENSDPKPIRILRDTGASQTLLLEGILPLSENTSVGASVLLQGVELGRVDVPLHRIYLKSDLITGPVIVGVRHNLPVEGVSMLLGNDLAKNKVVAEPIVTHNPDVVLDSNDDTDLYPSCVVTRAMAKKTQSDDSLETESKDIPIDLSDTFFGNADKINQENIAKKSQSIPLPDVDHHFIGRKQLVEEQKKDPELLRLRLRAQPSEEADKVSECYYLNGDVLMRKWRPPDAKPDEEWQVVHQIVVPQVYRQEIIKLAHDTPMAGHLGVKKTSFKILQHFYWPGLNKDVSEFCKSCHECQIIGKPNQKIPPAPLLPIPAFEEPFSRIFIDCVGPLPKTKAGNSYLLTIMCASTRFPEAIPLRNIKAPTIIKALVKFFTLFGLPKAIQSDQGSNFMSNVFQQVVHELGIKQYKSSAYHPESQGVLERFHQTLKNMIRTFCMQYEKDWDDGIHFLLFAARESVQESLGFSPFELVFGHTVRGPLKLVKEKWLDEHTDLNLLDYVSSFKEKLFNAVQIARTNLKNSQVKMKTWYDKNARNRVFQPGDKVLVFLPVPGHPLQARYCGPYEIDCKINDLNYVVKTPGRRKNKRVCHVNMLKAYFERSHDCKPVVTLANTSYENHHVKAADEDLLKFKELEQNVKLNNSDILANIDSKLVHLDFDQREEIKSLVFSYKSLFPDVPNKTTVACHDVDVDGATPIKQHPYRLNPLKLEAMRKELKYMLENDIIEPSTSEWSSPCILVPKPDKSFRFVTDLRRVNSVSKTDSFPIPRIDDCIDRIGNAKFVSKFDLLKGFWQIPLTKRASEVSAFVTPDGLYQYKVMPFGLKNAPATFQRMINNVIKDLDFCYAYIDDLVVCSDNWSDHMKHLHDTFDKLSAANLTVNLGKSEFCKATVNYLGHTVGQGQVKPIMAKVEAILQFPTPTNKKQIMRYLGMIGFYRKFCSNFATVVAPLTQLLKKNSKFHWSVSCQTAFDNSKSLLTSNPVLITPDYQKPFNLAVDASDIGVGAVLFQETQDHVEKPISYFSKKFDKHQKNYSTIEKECLAILSALQYFDVYLNCAMYPIQVFTDHNPLTFLHKMKNKNQRLTRWSLLLQEYDIVIKHIKGKDNVIADALSRC